MYEMNIHERIRLFNLFGQRKEIQVLPVGVAHTPTTEELEDIFRLPENKQAGDQQPPAPSK